MRFIAFSVADLRLDSSDDCISNANFPADNDACFASLRAAASSGIADSPASLTLVSIFPTLKPFPALFCIRARPNAISAWLLSTFPLTSIPVALENSSLYCSIVFSSGPVGFSPLDALIKSSIPAINASSDSNFLSCFLDLSDSAMVIEFKPP